MSATRLLNAFADELTRHALAIADAPVQDTVWALVETLATVRDALSSDQWKEACELAGAHQIASLLTEDPYTRDARLKPRGYAGDAHTLDFVYQMAHGDSGMTRLGSQLFRVTTGVPIAEAVRERSRQIADTIVQWSAGRPDVIPVASIASGHLRELDNLPHSLWPRVSVWGIDQDALSVAECARRFATRPVATRVGTVRDLLAGRTRIPPSVVVYAAGLFDYLDDRAASLLIRRMVSATIPGGVVLVPNLTPANAEIAYMEAIMNWWMTYRTQSELEALAETSLTARDSLEIDTFSSSEGRVAWLRVRRCTNGLDRQSGSGEAHHNWGYRSLAVRESPLH